MKIELTQQGRALLLNAMGKEAYGILFTRAAFGNGAAQNADSATALINPIIETAFSACVVSENAGFIELQSVFTNQELTASFRLTEVGFYACPNVSGETPDTEHAILFAVGGADSSEADYIAASDEKIAEYNYTFDLYVSNTENVSAILNANATYVIKADFDDHIFNKNNPHGVTKYHVGLGNVPNVATNDQTPTFDEAEKLENIKSGETLRKLLGKVSKSISELIAHTGNKENPHGVTAEQVKAAAKRHTHSATDINDGILPVFRGGTGRAEGADFTAYRVDSTSDSSYSVCYGSIVHPGGLLVQWGKLYCDGQSMSVRLPRAYADSNYVVMLTTMGDDFSPRWKVPTQSEDGFKVSRHIGASSPLLQSIFGSDGWGQVATWTTYGREK